MHYLPWAIHMGPSKGQCQRAVGANKQQHSSLDFSLIVRNASVPLPDIYWGVISWYWPGWSHGIENAPAVWTQKCFTNPSELQSLCQQQPIQVPIPISDIISLFPYKSCIATLSLFSGHNSRHRQWDHRHLSVWPLGDASKNWSVILMLCSSWAKAQWASQLQ